MEVSLEKSAFINGAIIELQFSQTIEFVEEFFPLVFFLVIFIHYKFDKFLNFIFPKILENLKHLRVDSWLDFSEGFLEVLNSKTHVAIVSFENAL